MKSNAVRIDSHQHFWKYNEADYGWMGDDMARLKKDRLPEDLGPILRQSGFDGSVAVQARQTPEETEWLLKLAGENDFIKGVVGWVDLRSDRVDSQLDAFSQSAKLVGVRHVVQDEADDEFILRPDFVKGIAKLEKYRLKYDILIFPKHIRFAAGLVKQFDRQMFVVDHIAKPFIKAGKIQPWKGDMEKLAAFENVYCKMSGMVTEADWAGWKKSDFAPYMETVLEMFGAGRVMFGSDWPVCTVAAEYEQIVSIVADFIGSLSHDEQAKIMGLNAQKFYNLTE